MPPSLRPTPLADGTGTPASAFARERRILSAYRLQLYAPTTDSDHLIAEVFGPRKPGKQLNAAEERLDYEVPELIERLHWDEQQQVEELLQQGALADCIRAVLKLERRLLQREAPRTAPDDSGHARAAGLGRISSENYGRLHPGYLFRLPEPKAARPMLRPKRRRRKPAAFLRPATQLTFWP